MANIYKNAFYDPSVTTPVTVYTTPTNRTAIVKNIQVTNESGSKIVKVSVTDSSASTDYQIAYMNITGATICNVAKAPVILESGDILKIESSVTSGISAIVSYLEIFDEKSA
jgi:capsular polysaccharide biosynthesis protein